MFSKNIFLLPHLDSTQKKDKFVLKGSYPASFVAQLITMKWLPLLSPPSGLMSRGNDALLYTYQTEQVKV